MAARKKKKKKAKRKSTRRKAKPSPVKLFEKATLDLDKIERRQLRQLLQAYDN